MNLTKINFLLFLLITHIYSYSQLDFHNEIYYTKVGGDLVSSSQNLSSFNFNSGQNSTTGGILGGAGVYFPVMDSYGNNLWVHLTWLKPDPNGNNVGANVPPQIKKQLMCISQQNQLEVGQDFYMKLKYI
ncbi:MAG: hypothetical protein IPJ43_12875 [Saprospiraceae bacterium]|nr:hypothetical protein [Saprospiraceae bacterium]